MPGSPMGGGGGSGEGGFSFTGSTGGPDAGCDDAEAIDAGSGCTGDEPLVHYSSQVLPIFQACTGELCHGAPSREGLVGQLATECCDGRSLVKPGDARGSYLMNKIANERLCAGGPMPLGEPMLPMSDREIVRAWICGGAKSN